jgi:hypothetical protein
VVQAALDTSTVEKQLPHPCGIFFLCHTASEGMLAWFIPDKKSSKKQWRFGDEDSDRFWCR